MKSMVEQIANAVLYEGYLLYPYRPSALKNRQRFNFGVIYPPAYSEAQAGTDACMMQTECLVQGNQNTQCVVRVRFLRVIARSIRRLLKPASELSSVTEGNTVQVERLEVGGKVFQTWQEAVEEEVEVTEFDVAALAGRPMQWPFRLPASQEREPVRDERNLIVGIIKRDKENINGLIELAAERLAHGLFTLMVRVSNVTRTNHLGSSNRDKALSCSLISTHTVLEAREGEFISLVDPPETCREFAMACKNVGTWPVLVGKDGERHTMLSSPIILYDYPQIAPESPGDLFDGAEIDEILSLRIMTMSDDEKREMRESDERARQILERTEGLPDDQWMKLHGALRGLRALRGEKP
jgi:hydrogenase maturation protease